MPLLYGLSEWFDNMVRVFSPKMAMERNVFRHRDKILRETYQDTDSRRQAEGESYQRSIEALSGSRNRRDFLTDSSNADSAASGSLETLRRHIRQQELNNGHFAGPIQRWANHVVGSGLKFQSRLEPDRKGLRLDVQRITRDQADMFNFLSERKFGTWNKQADKCLIHSFYRLQWLACAAKKRDGEVLLIGRNSKKRNRLIPYCLELLEIDRLQTPFSLIADPSVRNGIRFDDEGAPSSYYILKRHPGDYQTSFIGAKPDDYEEVPVFNENGTRKIFHLARLIRPEQTRGLPSFTAALKGLQTAFRYAEAEMFAALEDACMVGIVTTPNPMQFQQGHTDGSVVRDGGGGGENNTQRYHGFDANKWYYMQAGQDVKIRAPERPNEKFDEIIKSFSRDPANALDMPLEFMLQDWHNINYSNARTIFLQFYVPVILEQAYLIDVLCEPVWENILSRMVALGVLPAPGFLDRKEDYLASDWIPPKREWVDPRNEIAATEKELSLFITNPYDTAAGKSKDFDANAEATARALRKIKDLEEQYGIEMPGALGKAKAEAPPAQSAGDREQGKDGKEEPKNKLKIVKGGKDA